MSTPKSNKYSKGTIVLALMSALFSALVFLIIFTITTGLVAAASFAVMMLCTFGALGMAYQLVTGKSLISPKSVAQTENQDGYYDPETGEVYDGTSRKYNKKYMLAEWEARLTAVWEGSEDIEFTYEKNGDEKIRRKITLKQVLLDPKRRIYFRGFCKLRGEERTFDTDKIITKILKGGKRQSIEDFLADSLGIPESTLWG